VIKRKGCVIVRCVNGVGPIDISFREAEKADVKISYLIVGNAVSGGVMRWVDSMGVLEDDSESICDINGRYSKWVLVVG